MRWNLAIVSELGRRSRRFNELCRALGISRKMLLRRLHMLQSYGIVERRASAASANAFEYALTDSGRELHLAVVVLNQWATRHLDGPKPLAEAT